MRKNFNSSMYYSYGSQAYDYDYENDYNYIGKRKYLHRSRKKIAVKSKAVPALIMFLSLIFVGSLFTLCSFCTVKAKSTEIINLQDKLKTIKAENIVFEEEISKKFDLENTKKIAQTKLGMHKPLSYQIVHIKKPNQNYVIKYNW